MAMAVSHAARPRLPVEATQVWSQCHRQQTPHDSCSLLVSHSTLSLYHAATTLAAFQVGTKRCCSTRALVLFWLWSYVSCLLTYLLTSYLLNSVLWSSKISTGHSLFSPLGKLAGRAIYFADVFLYYVVCILYFVSCIHYVVFCCLCMICTLKSSWKIQTYLLTYLLNYQLPPGNYASHTSFRHPVHDELV